MFSVLREYLSNSSFHGLHFLVDPGLHWTERLFWLLSVLACWAGCVYLTLSWMEFAYLNPIYLSVDTNYLRWKTPSPAFVVCETNSPRLLDIEDVLVQKQIQQRVFFNYDSYEGTKPLDHKYKDRMWMWAQVKSNCSEIFNYCSDIGEFDCCEEFKPIYTTFGMCYAVNTIQINDTEWDSIYYINVRSSNIYLEFKHSAVRIYAVSNDEIISERSRPFVSEAELDSYEEIQVYLAVSETTSEPEIRQIDIERRKCRFSDENYVHVARNYSFDACKLQCQKEAHLNLMNCTHHYMPFTDPKQICTENQLIELMQKSKMWHTMAEENCDCELGCVNTDVLLLGRTSVTERTRKLNKNDSMLYVHINIAHSTVKVIRRMAHSMLDNIVNVGGTAGLFAGASLLSIIEIIYFFTIRALDTTLMKKSQRRKVKPRNRVIVAEPIFIEVYPFVN